MMCSQPMGFPVQSDFMNFKIPILRIYVSFQVVILAGMTVYFYN